MNKLRVGVLGATGMVGQRFLTLLEHHPWFEVVTVAASPASAGMPYKKAVSGRWKMEKPIPRTVANILVQTVEKDLKKIAKHVDMVFCALEMDKEKTQEIEIRYAQEGVAVISNNSAHRWTPDIPMLMPEINADHVKLIDIQRKKRKWKTGLIVVKPNCSIQSYVSILTALLHFRPVKVQVTSLQAISGAGKTFKTWPEMIDNVIPFIGGEEEKSEKEPMKIWGKIKHNTLHLAKVPLISATCIRVPVSNGHMAAVSVTFEKKPTQTEILKAVAQYKNPLANLNLPSAPKSLITYFHHENRPQTTLDRGAEHGMGITMGRLQKGTLFDWKFIALSHNTIRGAAGGSVLSAEFLYKRGYIQKRIT